MVEDLPRRPHLSSDAQVLRQQAHGVRHDGRSQEQQKTFRWIDLLYFIVVNFRHKLIKLSYNKLKTVLVLYIQFFVSLL